MNKDIRERLDRITNVLWAGGVTNPFTYVEQIGYLIFLKLLDEEEDARVRRARITDAKVTDTLFPGTAERYRWRAWRVRSGDALVKLLRDEVFPYLGSLEAGGAKTDTRDEVAAYFRDARLEIQDPAVLKRVIDELDQIEFNKLGPDVKGDLFEYLLQYLGKENQQVLGQMRTPRQIRAFMVEMVAPEFADTIYDPACGTGGFLVDALGYVLARYSEAPEEVPIYGEEWLERQGLTLAQAKGRYPQLLTYRKGRGDKLPGPWIQVERAIYGTDVSRQMLRIATMNLILHGVRRATLKRANVLSRQGGLSDQDRARRYRVVLSNPPFAGELQKDSIRDDLGTTAKKSELLFLALMMDVLAPGGRCAVVVPDGLLFGSTGAHKELRRKLVMSLDLQAVVSLPAGAFKPYAGVKTSVLVFRRPQSDSGAEAATKRVWFYDVQSDGYDPDRIQGGGRPETPERNDIPALLDAWAKYRASGFETPPGVEGDATLQEGSAIPRCWWVSVAKVEETEWNLTASRYRPRVAEATKREDPTALLREVIALEREVVAGAEKLLAELEGAA